MCLTCQWKVGGRAMTRNEEKADSYEIRKMSVNMEGKHLPTGVINLQVLPGPEMK
jgi:hypothetical protein